MNRIMLIGNLTKDPDLRETNNGIAYCKLSLAVSRKLSRDETDYFNVTCWRNTAQNCAKYLQKGSKVYVSGEVQTKSYTTSSGERKNYIDIIADDIEFLTTSKKSESFGQMQQVDVAEENLPF